MSKSRTQATKKKLRKEVVVMVSGCFDPLHVGHLRSFQAARALGDKLVVIVDGDAYTLSKKGAVFMPLEDRVEIISQLRCVDQVISLETHGNIAEALRQVKPDILANGGDVESINQFHPEEIQACKEINCKIIFGVGGGKIRASSQLLRDWVEKTSKFLSK